MSALSPYKSICIVIGGVAGGAVFLLPSSLSQQISDNHIILAIWIIGGMVSLAGALTYSELAAVYPGSGGEYLYLNKVYGPTTAFLYGWTQVSIAQTASIAALAIQFVSFLDDFHPFAPPAFLTIGAMHKILAIVLILGVSALNCFKINLSSTLQSLFVTINVGCIVAIGLLILFSPHTGPTSTALGSHPPASFNPLSYAGSFIIILWAYDGWNNVAMIGSEIKNPSKTIPIALIVGLSLVIGLYLLVNLSYSHLLSNQEIASCRSDLYPSSPSVAAKAIQKAYGIGPARCISLFILLATVTVLNNIVLASARIPHVMANDRLFLPIFGKCNANDAPFVAILAQAVIACMYVITGTYDTLVQLIVFSLWIFYALAAASVFIFRKNSAGPTYKTPGYPFTPLLFILSAVFLIVSTIVKRPVSGLILLLFLSIGYLSYRLLKKINR